ncbi:leucyl/phenylalanyl-tRNA--protein transferase [Aeromicrobium sp. UC242_57]|uniref:leucyl/phenylalanyl-tRNA--protein transferase n=1 Tax=Aeromicrobium sp. UC242_57 TaxID=3374624 RepID=UPI0037AE8838
MGLRPRRLAGRRLRCGGRRPLPPTVVEAYRRGAFPMPHGSGCLWWSPMERGVLVPSQIKVSRSLRRSMRSFTVTVDESFEEVIDACADPSRPGWWIDAPIREAYVRLHRLGWGALGRDRDADGQLVGGLYGLSIGALFAGESMFHRATDASRSCWSRWPKIASATQGLIDTQWSTLHLGEPWGSSSGRAPTLPGCPRDACRPASTCDLALTSGGIFALRRRAPTKSLRRSP